MLLEKKSRFNFRIWDNVDKKMHRVGSIEWRKKGVWLGIGTQDWEEFSLDFVPYESPDYEILQATGYKDVNKDVIYEGDIVEIDIGQNRLFEVVWVDGGFDLEGLHDGKYYGIEWLHMEIKGNIYQDKELLVGGRVW